MESALSLRSEEDWIRVSEQSREQYESGGLLLDRMGAESFLDPKLIATLMALRQRRMVESGRGLVKKCVNEIRRRPSARLGSQHVLR